VLLCFDNDIRRRRCVKVFGEFEPAEESKLVESLWSVSVSVELFLRPVARRRRPDTEEDIVLLDCIEGVRTSSLRRGAGKLCQEYGDIRSRSLAHSQEDEDGLGQQWGRQESLEVVLSRQVVQTGSDGVTYIRHR
jgi:hypothetical protein